MCTFKILGFHKRKEISCRTELLKKGFTARRHFVVENVQRLDRDVSPFVIVVCHVTGDRTRPLTCPRTISN